jgi:hypothetical protein
MTPFTLAPRTLWLLAALGLALMAYVAVEMTWPVAMGKDHLSDFNVFHLVGQMIRDGALAQAYDPRQFVEVQGRFTYNEGGPMFWSYPPPFNLVVAPLGHLPIGVAYLLFAGGTLAFYLWVLRRLAGARFQGLLLLLLPLMALIVRGGQNGLLTGALLGLTCLLVLDGKRSGGAALGLMIIKPHLALGLGLALLLRRAWWAAAALSILVAGLVCLAATLLLGPEVWGWFRHGIAATRDLLTGGTFTGFRMNSTYSFVSALGLSPRAAMTAHLAVLAAAVAVLAGLRLAGREPRVVLGFGLVTGAVLSPYIYDYDLLFLGIAAAVLAEPVVTRARRWEVWALGGSLFVVGAYGLVASTMMNSELLLRVDGVLVPVMTPVLLAAGVLLVRVLSRSGLPASARPGSVATPA